MSAQRPPPLLNVDQLADHLAVAPGYIRRLVRERRIPYRKVGKFLRFDPGDIDAFVEASRVDPLSR